MDNNLKPSSQQGLKLAYNRIKKNRAFRSEKKLSEASQRPLMREHRSSLRTELRALIEDAPYDESVLVGCIDELKQKLQQIKFVLPRKQPQPLQHQYSLNRKHSEFTSRKPRYKTNVENSPQQVVYSSAHLGSQNRTVENRGLVDLQEMRNQIKRRKQSSAEKRLATEKQSYRYQGQLNDKRMQKIIECQRKPISQSCNIKARANTQQVVRSQRNPSRIYHFSPKKEVYYSPYLNDTAYLQRARPYSIKRSLTQSKPARLISCKEPLASVLKEAPVIDNNEKIGDLSTIAKQKETLNFLGDSCVGIKQQLSPRKADPQSSKLLEFIDWRTNELKNAFAEGRQKKKRKTGLQKLSKIFPKGFFI